MCWDWTSGRVLLRRGWHESPLVFKGGRYSEVRESLERKLETFFVNGIDIVFIDKTKIVDEQISRLSDTAKRFKETESLEDLEMLVSKYETNIAGWLLNRDIRVEDESLYIRNSKQSKNTSYER